MADDDSDDHKITLVQHIFGKAAAAPGRNPPEPQTNDVPEANVTSVVVRHSPVSESLPPTASPPEASESDARQKQLKTAAELAEMIELDLARHPDCPKAGFRVTVYGGAHWRAMLTITPAAGGVRNPGDWRELTNELAERLRKRYDLAPPLP